MLIFINGQIKDYRDVFNNTSFPVTGISDEFLAENNAYKVATFLPYDKLTEKLVSCEPYIQDGFAYTVKVENKTAEEVELDTLVKASEMRRIRDELLAQSDWRSLRAFEQGLSPEEQVEHTKWINYRRELRGITSQPGFPYIDLPVSPDQVQE
jgi:hypothetical protein